MNLFILIFLFLILSCNYPDIDTVPKFNFEKTFQEKCSITDQINIEDKNECAILHVFSRL